MVVGDFTSDSGFDTIQGEHRVHQTRASILVHGFDRRDFDMGLPASRHPLKKEPEAINPGVIKLGDRTAFENIPSFTVVDHLSIGYRDSR